MEPLYIQMRSAIPRDLVSPSGYPSSVGASHPRRRLSSSVGTTYLRRTESGRPNLTLPVHLIRSGSILSLSMRLLRWGSLTLLTADMTSINNIYVSKVHRLQAAFRWNAVSGYAVSISVSCTRPLPEKQRIWRSMVRTVAVVDIAK